MGFAKLYTCNYGPAGNYIGGEMYKQGKACTKCPSGTSCSASYPGLCASASRNATISISRPKPTPRPKPTTTRRPKPVTTRRTRPFTTRRPTTTSTTTPRPTTTRRTTTRRTTTTTTSTTTTRRTTRRPFINSNSNRFTPRPRPRPRPTTARTTPRPQTTRRPSVFLASSKNVSNINLFECNFDQFNSKDCEVKFSGKDWVQYGNAKEKFYEIVLKSQERSELFFTNMVKAPKNGVACLSFRYRKYLDNGGKAPLQVIAWPYNGRPGKVNVQKSSPNPATWIRAQVTFRKVENFFVVLFRSVAPKSDNMYLAIDD